MPKSSSPLRLQEDLMQAATLTAERFHRSTAEQIEYWADLGRKVSTIIDPDTLLSLSAGLSQLKIEPVYDQPVNPDKVFNSLEAQREQGTLTHKVTNSSVKYQSSMTHSGCLEQIDQNGIITTGQFKEGQFIVIEEHTS